MAARKRETQKNIFLRPRPIVTEREYLYTEKKRKRSSGCWCACDQHGIGCRDLIGLGRSVGGYLSIECYIWWAFFYFFLVLDYSCAGPGTFAAGCCVIRAFDVYLIRLIHAMPICWPRFWVNVVRRNLTFLSAVHTRRSGLMISIAIAANNSSHLVVINSLATTTQWDNKTV